MADRPVVNAIRGKARKQQMDDVIDYDTGSEPSKSDDDSYTNDYSKSRTSPPGKDSNGNRQNPVAGGRKLSFLDTAKAIFTGK